MRLPAGKKKLSIVATLLVVGADIDRPGVIWARGGGVGGVGCCARFGGWLCWHGAVKPLYVCFCGEERWRCGVVCSEL